MTTTPHSPPQSTQPGPATGARPERARLSTTAKVMLFVVLPLLLLATVGALLAMLWPTPVHIEFREAGASRVSVTVPEAAIELLPSGDGEVHVEVTGWYSGTAPEFTVDTAADETVVEGGCRVLILSRCSLSVSVAVPASADVRIASTNGTIAVSQMGGSLDIGTTNGALRIADATGVLSLRTTNGSISVTRATSPEVTATTTNGQVELEFAGAPTEVLARSTNGGITVRVPEGEPYFVDVQTTNGHLRTEVESDRTAERSVTAETTNGSIAVEHTG
jgi:DUF4097 and DUF4098 domain-containing protein YvlB